MVGNFILRRRISGVIKHNFRPYNRWYTSPNENFEYGYPHSNALFNIYLSKAQYFVPNWSFFSNVKQLRQPITSEVTYDVGASMLYRRIYRHKFLMLSNQTSRYIRKCIRIYCLHKAKPLSSFRGWADRFVSCCKSEKGFPLTWLHLKFVAKFHWY